MMYLRTFLPWIVFAVVPSGSWQWGAVAALAVAVALIVQQRLAGRTADTMIIEIGSAVFFTALAILAFADPHSGLHPYSGALSNGMLALIAATSLAIRRPFTLGIAKQSTPREYWDLPEFIRINMIITAVWTASFVVTAALIALIAGHGNVVAAVIVQVAGLVVPMVFTNRFAAHAQAKAQAQAG